MMNRRCFPPLLSVLGAGILLSGQASARLGETVEQCTARYGPVVAETTGRLQGSSSVSFSKSGIRVRVEFLQGKAAFVSFSKAGLSRDEELFLLDSNAGGQAWGPVQEFAGIRCWIAPGAAGAEPRYASSYISGLTTWLDIADKTWTDAIRAQKAAMLAALPKPKARNPEKSDAAQASGQGSGKSPALPPKPNALEGF